MIPLPVRHDDQPFLGFKHALLSWSLGETFGPQVLSGYTGLPPGDRAACNRYRSADQIPDLHEVPDPSCSCGFYACRNPLDVGFGWHPNPVMLDVELFGKVVVYERGYRAERQRILRVGLPGCWYCAGPPDVIGVRLTSPFDQPQRTSYDNQPHAFCKAHVGFARADITETLASVSARTGIEWGHAPQIPIERNTNLRGS